MTELNQPDSGQPSMLDLFRVEAENQTGILTAALLEVERAPASPALLETLMRAAHSMKGAARIVNVPDIVRVAHAMEDCFVAAQHGKLTLGKTQIDLLLRGVDLLAQLSRQTDADQAGGATGPAAAVGEFVTALLAVMLGREPAPCSLASVPPGAQSSSSARSDSPQQAQGTDPHTAAIERGKTGVRPSPGAATSASRSASEPSNASSHSMLAAPEDGRTPEAVCGCAQIQTSPDVATDPPAPAALARTQSSAPAPAPSGGRPENSERVVRLNAESLNRLLGLAGESLVESRWLRPFADSLHRLKRHHTDLEQKLDHLRQTFQEDLASSERAKGHFDDLYHQLAESRQFLAERMQELDVFDRRSAHLSHRLYLEVLRTRMRPFADGVRRFPRMVRDLAQSLGKEVKLEIAGEHTPADRDILERLETPLAHLLRNAVDHGCETPAQRIRAGKSPECTIRLEARHSAGMLLVTVADDGAGVLPDQVRQAIIEKKLTMPAVAEKLTEPELLEFLFLPGFTLKDTVSEISGRGVGLDVVQNLVKALRGSIRLGNQPGQGLRVQLQLPLTLSVLRALLVEVAGEPYALPLTQISRTLKLPHADVQSLEGRHHFRFDGQQVGLLTAHQVLECGEPKPSGADLPIVVLGERSSRYGLVVDRFLGERELVVQPLDPRLGRVKDISAAALMEDGAPVLIVDVDDLIHSIEKLASAGLPAQVQRGGLELTGRKPKRVLAVDDSLTVRELERKLLANRGYLADVAVDGMDGWNAVRTGHYDLVITDVDMPRMDGIELAALIKKDPQLKSLPVLIVSYKDRDEDRMRGLEAGADYYLTKGSFHDETLLQAVADLIGEPES